MSQPSRILPQSKETLLKSYTKRLKDDVKSILDNFTEIVKSSKVRKPNPCMVMYIQQGWWRYVTYTGV